MTQSNTYDYSKEETNFTYRRRTSAIGVRIQTWYRPQIPCPLPGNTSQERTAFKCGSRTETGCIHSVCIQLDETICVRRYIGTEDKARPGSQANNGLLGRGIGQRCCITGTTKREKRQGTYNPSSEYIVFYDALKLKMGRMIVSIVTVSPMLAIISEAGL